MALANMIVPAAPAPRVFNVLLHNHASVEAALVRLAKRVERKGLVPLTWSWGKAFTRREHIGDYECACSPGCRGCSNVTRVPLSLVGEPPHYAGWTFIAALQHLDGENLVRSVGDVELPKTYRTRGPVCDHCQSARRRNDTCVLRHEDGRMVQVGSTCIGDFLGSDDAGKLADSASMLAAARGFAEEGESGGFGGHCGDYSLGEFLTYAAWEVRSNGWVSRTAMRESGRAGAATADRAWRWLTDSQARTENKVQPTAEDVATAEVAETWAETMTDVEVDSGKGDYLHNLRAVARSGIASSKAAGVAASMITAYQRAVARERQRAARDTRPLTCAFEVAEGVRATWDAVLDFVTGYETDFGYTTVCKFRTAGGARLVWKASSTGITREDAGKRFMVCGTVKKHTEYKGEAQTMISRADVQEFEQAAWDTHCAEERRVELAAKVKAGTATDEERGEHAAIQASRRAALKSKAARVKECMVIDSVTCVSPVGCPGVEIPGGITIYFDNRWDKNFTVYHAGRFNKHFSGTDVLTKMRKFVAGLLAEEAS